jgi:hypothetical protein
MHQAERELNGAAVLRHLTRNTSLTPVEPPSKTTEKAINMVIIFSKKEDKISAENVTAK